ncbi:hypothetical protein AB6A40_000753 [Gnathostoma spinigerum]|uniref:SMB domain-containing protein n=1 Tax=Gnathostoma spinigerum TaxID=75299 RepID=A0ABD6E9L3_9BILA
MHEMYLFLIYHVLWRVEDSLAGCYHQRLCCQGRNMSCSAIDDGIEHIPFNRRNPTVYSTQETNLAKPRDIWSQAPSSKLDHVYHPAVYDEHDHLIGQLVEPDIVELDGSGLDLYDRHVAKSSTGSAPTTNEVKSPTEALHLDLITSTVPTLLQLIFGEGYYRQDEPDITRYYGPHKIIRYSLLNRYLPLRISRARRDRFDVQPKSEAHILSGVNYGKCYCDEICIKFGDCCADYPYVCPPSDCYVTEWSTWSECVPDNKNEKCGVGIRSRDRTVLRDAIHGGASCPPLVEKHSCYLECHKVEKGEDIVTVALLVDYKFNGTREKLARNNIYWDLPEVANKLSELSYYCVSYKIGWVNRNCFDKTITEKLHTGNIICAECQPEAQMHRANRRCASDLEDGDHGFWKLIGPKSCYGMWTRISRVDGCRCSIRFPGYHSYLLV